MQKTRTTRVIFILLLLIVGILLFFTLKYHDKIDESLHEKHLNSLDLVIKSIASKRDNLVFGLQGSLGVYHILNLEFSPEKYRKYAESREFFKIFPAAMGFGFIRYIKSVELKRYKELTKNYIKKITTIDSDYSSQFSDSFIIEVIEPIEKNQKALGLDIGSEKNRRESAWASAIEGVFKISAPIDLVQNKKVEPGFLSYLPVYRSTEKKIENLVGWAYAPLRISLFLDDIIEFSNLTIDFQIQTTDKSGKSYMLFPGKFSESDFNSPFAIQSEINMGGQIWKIIGVPLVNNQALTLKVALWISFILSVLIVIIIFYWFSNLLIRIDESTKTIDKVEKWNEAVLNSSTYSIITTNPDGLVTTFNPAAERLLGYKKEEIINKHSPAIIHLEKEVVERTAALNAELNSNIQPGFETFVAKARIDESDTNEWTYVRKDGSHFPVNLCVTTLKDERGIIFGYMGIAEDLTEQKKLEHELEQKKSQIYNSSKMSALGEMAGGIAHEINNPLAIISNYSDMMKNILTHNDFEKRKLLTVLDKVDKTIERISKIISGLRNFSRNAENDGFVSENIESIINDTLELCYGKFKSNEIDLRLDIKTPLKALCKPTQISQVLMNLLNNAHYAALHSEERWVSLKSYVENGNIHISVTDSGNGIDEQLVEKIMSPFFTTKESGEGTGLGLSISLGIMKAHKGDLIYKTSNGHTQFQIILPLT